MDFWTRLIARTPLSGSSSKDAASNPIKRRQRFEKQYSQLLHAWRNSSNLAKDIDAAENIEVRLQELTNILADESRRPLPHPCIVFAATKQIYMPVAKIATTSYNEWIIKEAVEFFGTLIESEEEAFVENDAFSASLTNLLVRVTGANSIRMGPDTEVKVVELAFNITTKIRLEPSILPAWFKSRTRDDTDEDEKFKDERERFAGRTQKQDFPLFYLLMDYIHHDGKVGDFARTGLLYIIESASSSVALEQWIVESDLSTLMATGLGALYSQLSRKLVMDYPPQELPPVLALSDYEHPTSNYEIVSSCSLDFQQHLETFLSHLLFWQDVLNHCRSVEVKSTLLEHFQVIFLQQLLYPSLLESSDVDGGSSVAVLTYLRCILESLDHPDMINLILHYLLALPDIEGPARPSGEASVSAARKRKSMDLATMMATKVESSYSPMLFNLVDLIRSSLRSRNEQTVCVTLQLLGAIVKRHHRYAITTLLHTEGTYGGSGHRTRGAHEQEVEFLTTLAGSIGGQDNFDEVYDNILKDTMTRVESHPCSAKLVAPKTSTNNHKLPAIPDSLPGAPRDVPPHTLSPDDPVLNLILDLLETFFINPVAMNLSLTEAIIDMALCGYVSLEGWFLRDPSKYTYDDDDEEEITSPTADHDSEPPSEIDKIKAMTKCRRRPRWQAASLPRIFAVLETLANEVASFRGSVPRFEDLLQQRREAFQTADAATMNQPPVRSSSRMGTPAADVSSLDGSRSTSPVRPSAFEGFAQRLLSELGTPSRSASPRGRKEMGRSPRPASTMPGDHLHSTPSRPPTVPPKEFPMNLENPSRSGLVRSFSPSAQSQSSRGVSPIPSQLTAFAAVDQSILARKVGLPTRDVAPIPLNFEKNRDGVTSPIIDGEAEEASQPPVAQPKEEPAQQQDKGEEQAEGEQKDEDHQGISAGEELRGVQEGNKAGEDQDGSETAHQTELETPPEEKTASVSHIITNVIIFQSFLLELASLVQVRAGLFNEVRFI